MKADWSVYMDLATNSSEVQRRIKGCYVKQAAISYRCGAFDAYG